MQFKYYSEFGPDQHGKTVWGPKVTFNKFTSYLCKNSGRVPVLNEIPTYVTSNLNNMPP